MHIVNLFIIPLILVSLFFKLRFAYVIALLLSLAAAGFIYAQESLTNILFTIAIFNLVPLVCQRFNLVWWQRRFSLESQRSAAKSAHEQRLKERSLIRQSNAQLNQEVAHIVELYKMMRAMSSVLRFEEIFDILGKNLMQNFRFKRSRLIMVNEDTGPLKIKKVWEFKYSQPYVCAKEAQTDDATLLKQNLRAQRPIFIEEKNSASVPLMADSKFLGTLSVEELPYSGFENFSILADQFCLQFKRVRLYQKIQELAITDGLTGLFGRRYFLQRLDEEVKRSARHNLKLAFLMVDIDHFKQCNDKFGHLTGDAVLKEVAGIIKTSVREIDLVARFGGEEFSVLLPNTDKVGARGVAERIRTSIDRFSFKAYDESIKIEASVGVAAFPEDSTTAQELIDKADQTLYRAKQQGRNQVAIA